MHASLKEIYEIMYGRYLFSIYTSKYKHNASGEFVFDETIRQIEVLRYRNPLGESSAVI